MDLGFRERGAGKKRGSGRQVLGEGLLSVWWMKSLEAEVGDPDNQLLILHIVEQPEVKSIITRCSAIAERPRCRVHYSFRQK